MGLTRVTNAPKRVAPIINDNGLRRIEAGEIEFNKCIDEDSSLISFLDAGDLKEVAIPFMENVWPGLFDVDGKPILYF
jgi:hypothetical protein